MFLSSADSLLLVDWLEAGISVTDILRAMERAREARRKQRSKFPLTLTHVKRHLGRPTRGVFAKQPPTRGHEPPFAPVVRTLQASPTSSTPEHHELVERLTAIELGDGPQAVRKALTHVRTFLDARWASLGEAGRQQRRVLAEQELGDLLHLVDEGTAKALVEETARDLLHKEHPCLSAASLWELVGDDG
ncbi:MAG: hypothetical protein KTR31_20405 [Myxococcales bacterium]|nr:hypothetical protein [Myxococcales bacterium]